jgi:selenide,water dikinase
LTQQVAAAGCAAKLGPADLRQILHMLPTLAHPDLIVGTETNDDAGVFRLTEDLAIVNTVDFFTPIVDDPYVFGQVAAANALSDVYAMGGEPRTAMNIVGFPKGKMEIEVLGEVLKGGADKAHEAGVVVIGGHSLIDAEIKYGMAVTGVIHPDRVIRNVGVREGDALVLTKALGTGIITTAIKREAAPEGSATAAIASMVTLNRAASAIMREFSVHACSDITGFGLLGHGQEVASGSNVTLVLESGALPLLPRAVELAEAGYTTGGCRRNRDYLHDKVAIDESVRPGLVEVAFDPQTSGGLFIAVPREEAEALVVRLHAERIAAAAIVGRAVAVQERWVRLV